MLALINSGNYEEVMEDINNTIFNAVEPKSMAKVCWAELENYAENGASEEFLYREMNDMINQMNGVNDDIR